jgi:ribosomal protein S17E
MSAEHLFGDISGLKQSETDIRHIFNRYITTLFNTKWKISDEMTEWSKKLINQIQEYVAQQKELLEQEYAKKVICLNTLRDQVVEQALQYEEKKDTEHIKELINQCNTLKVELPMLVYVDRPIPSIQLISDEQMVQQSDNECTVQKIEDEQSPKELIENHNHDTISNSSTNENLLPEAPSTR